MGAHVNFQRAGAGVLLRTLGALVRPKLKKVLLDVQVDFHVVFQVSTCFELGFALLALEGSLPSVDAQVSLQVSFFVEPLAASGTVEGFVFRILNKKTFLRVCGGGLLACKC